MNPYELVQIRGYWWPADVGDQWTFSLKRIQSMLHAIRWCEEHQRTRTVVQAGGSIGVWPRTLSEHFQHVYTFEPEPVSFHCLCRNVLAANVYKLQAALGNNRSCVNIRRTKLTSHKVDGPGSIPQIRIDDLGLNSCDALLLDIEGGERHALAGAGILLSMCHPLVLVETRAKPSEDLAWIEEFLKNSGYVKLIHIELDTIYVHRSNQ